jgi:amino acid transporter
MLAVLTNNLLMSLISMLWLTGKLDVNARWVYTFLKLTNSFLTFPLLALVVMNFDRYLATSYPIFHRTSVTKGRLLTLLAILIIVEITLGVISVNDSVISNQTHVLIISILVIPAMLFINYKLFLVVRKSRRRILPETQKTFSLKTIPSCLLAVACVVVLTIPVFVYIGLMINSKETTVALDDASIAGIWAKTAGSMNGTFNCLIFYWKDKVLRAEGLKVMKSMKICRRVQNEPDQ